MEKILVSRCLLGHPVRYDGGGFDPQAQLLRWQDEGRVVAVCPEAMVLDGLLPVRTIEGQDVSRAFVSGAEQAVQLAASQAIRFALLKARSPSCGNHENYDGSFTGTRVRGEGVTAAALRRAGVRVFNESEIEQLATLLGE